MSVDTGSGFNPRTCERCDEYPDEWLVAADMFQSTHLREVRREPHPGMCDCRSFNPRTCERCDERRNLGVAILAVSIHAPARGATRSTLSIVIVTWFQSTHLREVRQRSWSGRVASNQFQSTHLREVRHYLVFDISPFNGFNPRTCERCDGASG